MARRHYLVLQFGVEHGYCAGTFIGDFVLLPALRQAPHAENKIYVTFLKAGMHNENSI